MIIINERDHRVAQWLATVATPEQIAAAVAKLGSRAWPTKLAKQLGHPKIPADVWDPAAVAAAAVVRAEARVRMGELRDEFKARYERAPSVL